MPPARPRKQPNGRYRYPWESWFRRSRLTLRRGEHFFVMPHVMAQIIRNAARVKGKRVSIRIEEDTLKVDVCPLEGKEVEVLTSLDPDFRS